jgi:hypothetical protein
MNMRYNIVRRSVVIPWDDLINGTFHIMRDILNGPIKNKGEYFMTAMIGEGP